MREALQVVARLSVPTFIVSSMLAMGLSVTPSAVLAPLRCVRRVSLALLVNFILSPAIAYVLTRIVPLERPYVIGLFLLSLAAGAPFLPKLAGAARADMELTVALMALLTAGTIVFMPLSLPLLVPGSSAGAWPIAKPLLLLIALPLAVGIAIGPRAGRFSAALRPLLNAVANLSLLVLLVLFVGLNLRALWGVVGSGAIFVKAVYIGLMFAAGYILGGVSTRPAKAATGLAASARNVGAALPAATASGNSDPKVIVMLLVGVLTCLLVTLVIAAVLRRRMAQEAVLQPPSQQPQPLHHQTV
jgi:BASS family bile acid:Na+ symporter